MATHRPRRRAGRATAAVVAATGALALLAVPVARSAQLAACAETPRPATVVSPALDAEAQAFGFHDEELVLCSPGAPAAVGGTPTHLAARLWVPGSCPPRDGCPGVLVVHGFGGTKETTFADMRDLVTRGLYVLTYDVRGQGASGGQADMMGRDTIADEAYVLRWFHDNVGPTKTGVYGISQGGAHALMAAIYNCGPARAAAFDSTVPCDAGGARWVDAIAPVQPPARFEDIITGDGTCSEFLVSASVESRLQPDLTATTANCLLDGTAADGAVEDVTAAAFGGDAGLGRENDVRDLVRRLDRIDVPVYLATSYFDRVVPASVVTTMYERLRARATDDDVRLIISNDAHGDVGADFAVLGDVFTWLERQLKGDARPLRAAPVASAQAWDGNSFRLEHDWPIPGTTTSVRALDVDGTIANVPVVSTAPWVPVAGAALAASPVPLQTVGLVPGDSLRWTSPPVTALTEITGLPELRLWLSTPDGGRYGQLTAALDDVAPDGTSMQFARVRRGFDDLTATPTVRVVPLSTSSWRLVPGHRLRLTLTATDVFEAEPSLANRGVVLTSEPERPSQLVLPLVDPGRTPAPGAPPSGASFTDDPAGALCAFTNNLACPPPPAGRR